MTPVTNVIICGTGGQGILLASEILCSAARSAGNDVKKSEVHGMAQRGGSVSSHVRFGDKIYSPLVEKGCADLILAMEKMEGLRWASYLAPSGRLVACDLRINPMTVNTGLAEYPDIDAIMIEKKLPVSLVPAVEIAGELGNMKVVNVVLIGAVSTHLPIGLEHWHNAVRERVPSKFLEINLEAFRRGRELFGQAETRRTSRQVNR
ncbi:MAG: indolepyruvate oxidoreductase subunit beta [Candidatus Fermentibacteraceae bacterium]|nr:indolepyruvate oxidoreductase subunit beta [Candidatus Fermentibacteraceae bacterium]MBN2609564.1 indolepyruvate oxidoreductase subunit beta [Candidatus Fermentibacteraceae bacterium]